MSYNSQQGYPGMAQGQPQPPTQQQQQLQQPGGGGVPAFYQPRSEGEKAYYDGLFSRADVNRTGAIGGREAVQFLSLSGLPLPILKQVWNLSDTTRGAKLSRTDFYIAMRLILLAQRGVPPSVEGINSPQGLGELPQFNGIPVPTLAPPSSSGPATPVAAAGPPGGAAPGGAAAPVGADANSPWAFTPGEKEKILGFFNNVAQGAPFAAGKPVVDFLRKSKVPDATLKQIWTLSDVDRDNKLSADEFCVAFKLTLCVGKKKLSLPPALPPVLRATISVASSGQQQQVGCF